MVFFVLPYPTYTFSKWFKLDLIVLSDVLFMHFYVLIFWEMVHFSTSSLGFYIFIRHLHLSKITNCLIITLVRSAAFFVRELLLLKWKDFRASQDKYPSFNFFLLHSWATFCATDSAYLNVSPCTRHQIFKLSFFFLYIVWY